MNQEKKVDFHMHSNASDGLFSPQELFRMAAAAGLAAAGLTDHDTVNGLPEAERAAHSLGLELIPGVEISVLDEGQELHILGYYPRYSEQLKAALEGMQRERFRRMEMLMAKLKLLGFKINPEEVRAEAGTAAPGRLHLARVLLKKKYVHTLAEAFTLYLGRNRPAFIPRKTPSIVTVMGLLTEVGAIPVFAHPGRDGHKYIDKLIHLGLKGIEVYHPDHGLPLAGKYRAMADDKGLLVTGGSDFHGDSLQRPLYSPRFAVPYFYLEQLKEQAG